MSVYVLPSPLHIKARSVFPRVLLFLLLLVMLTPAFPAVVGGRMLGRIFELDAVIEPRDLARDGGLGLCLFGVLGRLLRRRPEARERLSRIGPENAHAPGIGVGGGA